MALAGEDVRGALDVAQRSYGDAFVFGFGPIRYHWLLHLDGAELMLRQQPEAFGNSGAYGFLGPVGGATALINTDEPEHLRRRRAVQPAFHARALEGWVALAVERFTPFIQGPFIEQPGPLLPRLRPLVLEVVLDILLGRAFREAHPGFAGDVLRMMNFATLPFQAQLLKLPLPPLPWAAFVAARRRVDRALRLGIASRAGTNGGQEVAIEGALGSLAEPGHPASFSESEVRDQLLSLLAAGFDTSSAAIVWLMHLLSDADRQNRARAETRPFEPLELVRDANLAPFHHAIFQESLRLYPPAPAILRRTLREVQIGAATLPPGAGVALSIWHVHRDPRWWPEGDAVQPERWLSGDLEARGGTGSLAFLPFGHGSRFCIGAGLAKTLATTFSSLALRHSSWRSLGDAPKAIGVTLVPHDGLPMAAVPARLAPSG